MTKTKWTYPEPATTATQEGTPALLEDKQHSAISLHSAIKHSIALHLEIPKET